ncbi:hypothetical protein JHK87_011003 [Glycine soja]|nr:hypothetical protein JHK87_011003 [Glycine soja]
MVAKEVTEREEQICFAREEEEGQMPNARNQYRNSLHEKVQKGERLKRSFKEAQQKNQRIKKRQKCSKRMSSTDPWRNGSASDSRSEGCVFDSRRVQTPIQLASFGSIRVMHGRNCRRESDGDDSIKVTDSVTSLRVTDLVTTGLATSEPFVSRFTSAEPRKGSNILVETLERQGVTNVLTYPGGTSMEIHQAFTHSSTIRNILPHHEQGGVFAAKGYANSSDLPDATNLIDSLINALMDNIPIVAITSQVPWRMIGIDTFQETPIVEVIRSITKYN